uniref:Uncharacterized protein n=1 Tax=Dunaliella tertiolecta TaxID=3047 RepID=A0A7S3VIJ2_DUNTE
MIKNLGHSTKAFKATKADDHSKSACSALPPPINPSISLPALHLPHQHSPNLRSYPSRAVHHTCLKRLGCTLGWHGEEGLARKRGASVFGIAQRKREKIKAALVQSELHVHIG